MSWILNIETATPVCSVALARNGEVVACREEEGRNSHSSVLTTFFQEVLDEAGITAQQLDAVAVSRGPGSYTGLRIGVSAAKGLCYSLNIPLIALGTLQIWAHAVALGELFDGNTPLKGTLYCPMLDARRMEVYDALYDGQNHEVRPIEAHIIDENALAAELDKGPVVFMGDGADKCIPLLEHHPNARFVRGVKASARYMAPVAHTMAMQQQYVDVAYFEPYYLKEFIAGKPRVKGLR